VRNHSRQPDYWFQVREVRPDGRISWHDFADKYKTWARAQFWAQLPRSARDDFGFYREVGFAAGAMGSEFALTLPNDGDYDQRRDFLWQYHRILKQEKDSPARVLFVPGWDWHQPFRIRFGTGSQQGDRPEYWLSRYGSSRGAYRDNYDRIKNDLKDFLVPYLHGFTMNADFGDPTDAWHGWSFPDEGDPNAPWWNKALTPQPFQLTGGARMMCPATAFGDFLVRREGYIRRPLLDDEPPPHGPRPTLQIDGSTHDLGAGFIGAMCMWCDDGDDLTGKASPHTHGDRFRVGSGGFMLRAIREMYVQLLYGERGLLPPHGKPRQGLLGSEAVHELLIELLDFSGSESSWGPYRDNYVAIDAHGTPYPLFSNALASWIINGKGDCEEVPALQYVYSPVMPLKTVNGTLSRGTDDISRDGRIHDIGDAFYWLFAQAFLNGAFPSLVYANTPIDVLNDEQDDTSMPKDTATFVLGWNRVTERPNAPPLIEALRHEKWPPREWAPVPGRHPYLRDPRFTKYLRTYGDLRKQRYLRMLAYLRTHLLRDFIVFGEMQRPPQVTVPAGRSITSALMYAHYWSLSPPSRHAGRWTPPATILSWCWNGTTSGEDRGRHRAPARSTVLVVANVDTSPRQVRVNSVLHFPNVAAVRANELRLNPESESGWDAWQRRPAVLLPVNGQLHIAETLELASHEIHAIKLEPDR
jgi:hypothetical protein